MSGRTLLSLAQVAARTGRPAATIRALADEGRFPAPLPLGPWSFGWVEAEVDAWLAADRRAPHQN